MEDLNKVPKKNSELAWRIIDNETVIIPLDEQTADFEKIELLNRTATRIWELIDGKNTVEKIIDKICEEYEIEREEAQKEVISFINKLEKRNLVKM